jgi:5-methylcytosine-specific restriction protein B
MILADRIRNYVVKAYIEPARQRDDAVVRIRARDVHLALDLDNRLPAVCGALDAQKFLDFAGVRLVRRTGPHQGAEAEWVFEIKQQKAL